MRNRIIAFDPGKTSGWATFNRATETFESGQTNFDQTAILAHTEANTYRDEIDIVSESFIITVNTAKNTQATWSLELIGIFRYVSRSLTGQDVKLQDPASAKRLMSDSMLKVLGWHKPGKGHANDAARHLGTFLLSRGWMDDRIIKFVTE